MEDQSLGVESAMLDQELHTLSRTNGASLERSRECECAGRQW